LRHICLISFKIDDTVFLSYAAAAVTHGVSSEVVAPEFFLNGLYEALLRADLGHPE
jgi:hypothetical protein